MQDQVNVIELEITKEEWEEVQTGTLPTTIADNTSYTYCTVCGQMTDATKANCLNCESEL